ncbi:hypothetical protein R6Z07F_003937 [Ovis aries]
MLRADGSDSAGFALLSGSRAEPPFLPLSLPFSLSSSVRQGSSAAGPTRPLPAWPLRGAARPASPSLAGFSLLFPRPSSRPLPAARCQRSAATEGTLWAVRQNCHQDSEAAIHRQINLELYASYVYLSMSYYFDRDDVALKNFAKYFLHQSHEEREHAERLMKLQNQRGSRIFLQDIKKPDHDDWENGLNAMECALCLERSVNQSLLELHKLATEKNDPHLCDFIETHYLNEQVEAIKELDRPRPRGDGAARPPPAAAPGVKQERMKEVDNLESIKEEWVCETGSDHQPLSDSQQTNCEYFVDSLFEEAQKVGAKCLSPTEQKKQVDVSIKLWKNGFTVNDDFRSYSDGASQEFLNSIKKGELPLELQGVFDKEEVDVKVEDKKNEVCMSTKPVFQPFSGQGHRLGSATPKIVSKAKNIEVENKNKLSAVPLNNLEPITNIQIWLANGKRIVQKFNISHRISHIKDFIEKYQGSQRSPPFSLATALPFLKLLDETLTLEEADLQNAVIIQRLKNTAEPLKELS